MTPRDQIIFNLLFNSTCSFFAGVIIIFLSIKLFRVDTTRWKLFFLSLPFIKIIWDILQGIPRTSFLLHSIDPFLLPPKHKFLMFGLGFSKYGPLINLQFSFKNLLDEEYSISAADFLYLWLSKTFVQPVPKILLLIGESHHFKQLLNHINSDNLYSYLFLPIKQLSLYDYDYDV